MRSKKMPNGEVLTCYVVRKRGPRGGRTVCVVRHDAKPKAPPHDD